MEQSLLKLLLNHQFYEENKHRLSPAFFPDGLASIYEVIKQAHETYSRDLTLTELRTLHRVANPSLTRAARTNIEELFNDLEEAPDVGLDLASDVLRHMWRAETGRRIADFGLDLLDGKADSLAPLQAMLEKTQDDFVPADDVPPVTTDVEKLAEMLASRPCWQFSIPTLASEVPGVSGGEFMILFARPNAGKTASWITLCASPNGFCAQGARVHAICNEEPASRTMMRAVSCYTGLTREQIYADLKGANAKFRGIADNLVVTDNLDMTMEALDGYCRRHRPDILVLDQIDKIGVSGDFSRGDERFRAIYVQARELAKRYDCVVIGICQASADAEGKQFVTYSMMEGSKTGKAAEADLIIGIGRYGDRMEDLTRVWYISKNKINGKHVPVTCILNQDISRYEA